MSPTSSTSSTSDVGHRTSDFSASDFSALSAYFHIPFCETKCVYCDFYSIEDRSSQSKFVSLLKKEIALKIEEHPELLGRELHTIFFGGGTPSLLSPEELSSIISEIKKNFIIARDVEFTLECNPGTVTLEKLSGYRKLGVNRLSFGVQSFNADELQWLSRIHSADEARIAIKLAREAGFENVSLDLMFALPNQTKEKLSYSLDEALALGTDHISAYNLTVEEGTPLNRMVKLGQVGEMAQEEAAELFEMVQTRLAEAGYSQYEISNYAKSPATRAHHNLVYWDGFKEYVSFGPSAHEFLGGMRAWNVSSLEQYGAMIEGGKLPRINSEELPIENRKTEVLFCQLRATGIALRQFKKIFGEDLLRHAELPMLLHEGMVVVEGDYLKLTKKGYRFCDGVVIRLMK
ncbi:MAG: radical SAM family heme chaperone HemW [Bacteroidota bacterium]|nr:radical SAM family heme chaperone HemW [Bacteroidota bacterium]MDP4229817.1 radical SAM family heme chaperone HemW [Bacteroidota bacterium]MDP4235952.1 radical SAM family heme chaperone HemW [Bacteroidota bacterium]